MIETVSNDILERAGKIRLLILDVDGVLSDGKLYFSNRGDEIKAFNSLDGHGIKMLQQCGVEVAIITGRTSEIVKDRANHLGVEHVLQGRTDKLDALNEMMSGKTLRHDEIAHMGDDYPDLPVMRRVGLALTPSNAHDMVKKHSHWQSQYHGGEGAVREACDLIMYARGSFEDVLAAYL